MEPQDVTLDAELLSGYLHGTLTISEETRLTQWLQQSPRHQQALNEARLLWEQAGRVGHLHRLNVEGDWSKVAARINQPAREVALPVYRRRTFRQLAAAVVLLVVAAWAMFYWQTSHDPLLATTTIVVAEDTITNVTLPDGSQVFLNTAARLSYQHDFNTDTRTVVLSGEGYFEVAHNPAVPFLIHTDQTIVRVVGTTFNVNAADSAVRITVNSGKVAFSHQYDTLTLTRDAVGVFRQDTQTLRTFHNDSPNYLAWKTGKLTFNNTPLQQVVQDLQKHYRVPIQITNEELKALTFTGAFDQQPLEEVLLELSTVLDAHYSYQNNQIIFS